jgi:5'-3' exonuclease
VKPCPCPPHRLALYKALVGDPSDNIKGIPQFGPKAFAALEAYWADIEAGIDNTDKSVISNIPFKPMHKAWLLDDPNLMLARAMLTITRFFDVPDSELDKGIKKGTFNYGAADQLFRRFFL